MKAGEMLARSGEDAADVGTLKRIADESERGLRLLTDPTYGKGGGAYVQSSPMWRRE